VTLSASFSFTGNGQLTKPLDVSTPTDTIQVGSSNFPACGFDLTDGTSNLQAKSWWSDIRTVAAGATDSIDLNGSLTGPLGDAISWTTVRMIVVAINVPDGTKLLRVGPQNVTNAAQLGFGGVGAQAYLETDTFCVLPRPYGGWAVTAGTADIARINNPSAVNVTVTVWILATETP
jgi:hypothetical protein